MSDSESDSETEKIHRKKRSVVVKFQFEDTSGSSSSGDDDDDDDDNVAGPSNRNQRANAKKTILNTSNDESTSDSDVPLKTMQEKRARTSKAAKLVADSDEESSDDSWSPIKNRQTPMPMPVEQVEMANVVSDNANSSDSDSSCDLLEKCPICLHAFREQEIGTPSVCEHDFCAPCIQEWSSNVQTCPIDRKPFTIIRVRSRYVDGVFVRETGVKVKTTDDKSDEMDFTHCEICNRSDREDIMLLCDGCDAGYHMDCLMPPLTEIPEGSWYCDNCFASDASEDDITQVLAEMETLAVPETRLRVRREVVPRITRTRQSERIRTTILNRRQGSQQASARDILAPGPSRSTQTITTTTTTVTSTTTTKRRSKIVKRKVKKRRRKVQRKRRTYVVEYDVDEYNNKFGIKTANRIIRKRRRKAKKSKRAGCGRRKSTINRSGSPIDLVTGGVRSKGLRKEYPTLSLFGNKNALDYFSDESENDEGIGSLNNSLETGDGLLIMSRARSNNHRNLIRRKNVAVNSSIETAETGGGVDILSNIMDTMNRWHTISRPSTIDKIRINSDGSFECDAKPPPAKTTETAVQPNADIQHAPMNPRNGGADNRNFNNSNGCQGNNANQNAGNYSNNRFGGQNEATSFNPFQRAGGSNNSGNFGGGFQNESFLPRNRLPFQRQRNNLNNITSRLARNQMQSIPQLYDGEDILPVPNVPTQSDNDLNSRLKSGQQEDNAVASNAQADQSLPSAAQEQIDQNVECDSNDVRAEAIPPVASPSQEPNVASTTGEVSSSYEQPVSTTSGVSSSVNYSDSDDADDAFEYSAESMQVAKENDSPESTSKAADQAPFDDTMENDEDLVQLDDDEHFANVTGISDEQANQTQADHSQTIESPIASPETTTNTETECTENIASNHAHENNEQPPNSSISNLDNETEDVSETEAEAEAETDAGAEDIEPQPSTANADEVESLNNDKNTTPTAGIEGMDTEMISEDEMVHDDGQKDGHKANKEENNNRKSDRDDSFKKVSKSNKERNYRDKRDKSDVKSKRKRSRTRSRSRSRSRNRSRSYRRTKSSSSGRSRSRNRGGRRNDRIQRKDREKRRDIQRYDVRTLIADRQPRSYKDKYGRDNSRQRSLSPRRAVKSKSRSYSRSVSPGISARRRSLSRRRRSPSRRSSVRRRRSISRGRRSISRGRGRRSISRGRRKKSISRSPMYYTSSRSRSYSRGRGHLINGQSRSRSRSSRSYTPKPAHGTLYHMHDAFSRSRSRDKKSKKKATDKRLDKRGVAKGRAKKKARSPIHSPVQRGGYTPLQRRRSSRSRSKSWNEAASWNRSLSDVPNDAGTSWTPPIAHVPENLTVILKNKDSKRSKRDKKRKVEKRKTDTLQKKEKRKRTDKQSSPSLPSKEVFASGDNILVSVSFNKDKPSQPPQQTTIVTLPPTKEQVLGKKTSDRDGNSKRSRRTARDAPRKHRKVNIKPVAIIDLDNSPFKEVTPSPRAVIILSDSDHENDKSAKNASHTYSMASNASETISNDKHHSSIENRETNIRVSSPPQSPTAECADFELPLGPKTPPEPSHLVKFSISSGTKMKIVRTVVNPLHDDNDDDDDEDDNGDDDDNGSVMNSAIKESNIENAIQSVDKVQNSNAQSQPKVGPNTPPGPCSPDVYDPFEPTKSPSQSPTDSMRDNVDEAPTSALDDSNKSTKSVDLSMALINSKASIDAANTLLSTTLGGEDMETDTPNDEPNVSPYKDKPIDDGFRENAAPKSSGIHVFSNVLLTPAKDSSRIQTQPSQSRTSTITITNLSTTVSTISATKQSPMKFTTGSIISKLPLPKITKPQRHNGNDDNMDIESPYSPGSSDYEDWFEPPQNSPPTGASHSKHTSSRQTNKTSGATTSAGIFDDLFGSSSPPKMKSSSKRKPSKHSSSIKDWIAVSKHSTQISGYGKLNEEQLRILDDVPSSAVELQVKDKFLRKLNRQERVIEEVKLVLKPHYNKKHVTKDEYKDIMRRAVPKICHNRTGEINPKKIKKLIEAYVAKFRAKRKLQQSTSLVIK